jgi:hypothetical protein
LEIFHLAAPCRWVRLTFTLDRMFVRAVLHSVRNTAAGLRAQLRTSERRFYAKLHALRAEREAPINYKSLTFEENQIRYVNLSGREYVVVFDEIEKVDFVREEALFDDLYGPYLETKWSIHLRDTFTVEVMDETTNRRKLVGAFVRVLPGFQEPAALVSEEEGRWVCFDRRGPRAEAV